jgi:group I intron endonuclease
MTTFIYALKDPLTDKVRYIGKSNNPKLRYYAHLSHAKKTRNKTHRDSWIISLLNQNLKPILFVIEETTDELWKERERYYISRYSNLTNHTIGGEGAEGFKHSKETRILFSKIRTGSRNSFYGKSHTKEAKELFSKNRVGKRLGAENSFYGKGHTKETKQKLSEIGYKRWTEGSIHLPPVMKGENNYFSLHRIFISPNGEIYNVYTFRKFCKEHDLSDMICRENINKGKIFLISSELYQKTKSKRKCNNCIGWEIIEP